MSDQPMPTPDYSTAFVKVPRDVLRQLLPYQLELRVYLELLDRAAYRAGPRMLRGHGVVYLEAGQAVYGRTTLAEKLSTTPQAIRTAISHLADLGILTTKSTNLGTIATLCGYGEIGDTTPADQPADQPGINQQINQRPTNDQPADQPLTDKRRDGDTKKRGHGGDAKKGTASKSPSAYQRVVDRFFELFKEATGAAPTWKDGDGKNLKALLAQHSADEVIRRMEIMFSAQGPHWIKERDFKTLVQHFDKFVQPSGNGTKAPSMPTNADYSAIPEGMQ